MISVSYDCNDTAVKDKRYLEDTEPNHQFLYVNISIYDNIFYICML